MIVKAGKVTKEVEEAKEKRAEIAAFFDLDGTLMARPSLERRFFHELRYRGAIGWKNCLQWLAKSIQIAPRGITAVTQANKMYLRGVAVDGGGASLHTGSARDFFVEAIQRVTWHAERRDTIVIVSGTLEFLARGAARELEMILSQSGFTVKIHVCATRLEEKDGRWTGRILGEAMFGGAKARAAGRFATQMGCDLKRSYAYGDSAQDRQLLEAVGYPCLVNPPPGLSRLAQQKNWQVVWWKKKEELTFRPDRDRRRAQEAQSTRMRSEAITRPESLG